MRPSKSVFKPSRPQIEHFLAKLASVNINVGDWVKKVKRTIKSNLGRGGKYLGPGGENYLSSLTLYKSKTQHVHNTFHNTKVIKQVHRQY